VDEFIFQLRKYSPVNAQYSTIEFAEQLSSFFDGHLPRAKADGGTRCPQRVGKARAVLPPDMFAPLAIPFAIALGEADPPA
jgi:hypothetical protein